MKNLNKLCIGLVALCLTLGTIQLASAKGLPDKKVAKGLPDKKTVKASNKTIPVYTIPYIQQNVVPLGTFETEGYVTFIHQIKGCKNPNDICPPGSDTSVIIVSDQKNGPENTAIRIKITKDTTGLQKGGHYHFTVEAKAGKLSAQSPLQMLQLVKFEVLQPK